MHDHFNDRVGGSSSRETGQTEFNSAFNQAFLLSAFNLLTFNEQTVAIYSDIESDLFLLFDSHARLGLLLTEIVLELIPI